MSDPTLPGMPEISESNSTPDHTDCTCEAKFAEVSAAVQLNTEMVEQMRDKMAELVTAVNTLGTMVQSIQDGAKSFLGQFAGMNPMDLLRGALGGSKR